MLPNCLFSSQLAGEWRFGFCLQPRDAGSDSTSEARVDLWGEKPQAAIGSYVATK
jgi:hypothetical protein